MIKTIVKAVFGLAVVAYVVMLWLSVALSMDDLYVADELEDWE